MWLLVAAETPTTPVSDQLILTVGGIITAAIVTLGGVLVAIVNSRSKQTTASPPPVSTAVDEHVLFERTAVLARRADDGDERDAVEDQRIDKLERWAEQHDPGWWRQ